MFPFIRYATQQPHTNQHRLLVIPGTGCPGEGAKSGKPCAHHDTHRRMNEFWVGMGCFWGAEKLFWETPGVTDTQVGYAGGRTSNPSYRAVCSGSTGHAEVVRVRFDPQVTSLEDLVVLALENHDPTQGNRQGADIGTQYRSVFFLPTSDDAATVERILDAYGKQLAQQGYGPITAQVVLMDQAGTGFWAAEDYHQRYLEKNPGGYCPHHGTGVCYVR